MNVITHPWESENGFVGMGSTISRTRLRGDGGRLSPFHYTQASTVMKAILIGFNACGGARSCFLMALTKEYESVIIKSHSTAVPRTHWSSFNIPPFWMGFSWVRGQWWSWNPPVPFTCFVILSISYNCYHCYLFRAVVELWCRKCSWLSY